MSKCIRTKQRKQMMSSDRRAMLMSGFGTKTAIAASEFRSAIEQ